MNEDYVQRVYAGILGKIVGIYFGLPMEGWPYETVVERLGRFNGYTNGSPKTNLNRPMPLVNLSDDINGMFTFIRALSDNENRRDVSAADVGRTWLNNFIFERTATWWGGMCFSTEHTAMVRLLSGIEAPRSGSIELNGRIIAEQIGGRIFVDSWPMVAPGNPELAAELARKGAGVSHGGESIYGAQVVAVMEAQAFVEGNLDRLFDTALKYIPEDSVIAESTLAIREWHASDGDWNRTRERIYERYGYDKFGGPCHIVPNHALVVLGLLYGEDDLRKSLVITATAGWDTDCNCSAVGCILGIKNGLAAFDAAPDLRFPVEDRLYTSTADSGRSVTDAVIETYHIANIGRSLAGLAPLEPKNGARFHFEMPGSVQCFRSEKGGDNAGGVTVENIEGHSENGKRSLTLRFKGIGPGTSARISTATFCTPESLPAMFGDNSLRKRDRKGWIYRLVASPTLYSGQEICARVSADAHNAGTVRCALHIRDFAGNDELQRTSGPGIALEPGRGRTLTWTAPDTEGRPIGEVGIEVTATERLDGAVYLDYLTWNGAPRIVLRRTDDGNDLWHCAFASSVDQDRPLWCGPAVHRSFLPAHDGLGAWGKSFQLNHGIGRGMMIQGTRDWKDYAATSAMSALGARNFGIAARVQGVRRYYGLVLSRDQHVRIIKMLDREKVLAETEFSWQETVEYELRLEAKGHTLTGFVNGRQLLQVADNERPLTGGGIALILEEGHLSSDAVAVTPIDIRAPLEKNRRS